ncbi:MAG: hypothetical protein H7287_02345 [Thermoleophilia bacterium]|nr:hypothetical protein [Thermoleophilia bacterium]
MTGFFWLLLVIVLFAVFGAAVVAAAWFVLWYAVVGLVIGGLARLLVSDTSRIGTGGTIVAGLIGSISGGWVARAFDLGWLLQIIVAVIVASLVVSVVSGNRRA